MKRLVFPYGVVVDFAEVLFVLICAAAGGLAAILVWGRTEQATGGNAAPEAASTRAAEPVPGARPALPSAPGDPVLQAKFAMLHEAVTRISAELSAMAQARAEQENRLLSEMRAVIAAQDPEAMRLLRAIHARLLPGADQGEARTAGLIEPGEPDGVADPDTGLAADDLIDADLDWNEDVDLDVDVDADDDSDTDPDTDMDPDMESDLGMDMDMDFDMDADATRGEAADENEPYIVSFTDLRAGSRAVRKTSLA